jgi:hypothetical protein
MSFSVVDFSHFQPFENLKNIYFSLYAGIAQLVEHQLPKLGVAGSSLVSRSVEN